MKADDFNERFVIWWSHEAVKYKYVSESIITSKVPAPHVRVSRFYRIYGVKWT